MEISDRARSRSGVGSSRRTQRRSPTDAAAPRSRGRNKAMTLLGVKPSAAGATSSKANGILGMSSMFPSTIDVPSSDLGGSGGGGSKRSLLSRGGSRRSFGSAGSGSRGNGSYCSSAGVIPNLQPQHHPNYKANLQQERSNGNGNGNNGSASAASSSGRSLTPTAAGDDTASGHVRTLMDAATSRIIVSNGGGVLVIADRKLRDMQSYLEEITRSGGGGSSSSGGGGGDGANHSESQDQDKSSSEEIIELVSTLQEKNDRSEYAVRRLMRQVETLRSERDAAIEKSEGLKGEMESRDEREMEAKREVERRKQKKRETLNAFIAKASHGEPSQEQWTELVKLATRESPARGGSSAKSEKSDKKVRFAEADTDNHRRYTQTLRAVLKGRKEDAGSKGARASWLRALLGLVLVSVSATFLWRYRAGQDAISAFPDSHPPAHATDVTPEASSSIGGEGLVEAAVDSSRALEEDVDASSIGGEEMKESAVDSSSAPEEDGEASSIGGEEMKESAVDSSCAPGEVGAIECG